MPFSLEYLYKETHLVLPRYSPYTISQTIYEMLFQYVLTPEKETLLKNFIQKLNAYTKSHADVPFSISLSDLEFLGEGWQELKLLNWFELPVSVFQIHFDNGLSPEEKDDMLTEIYRLMYGNFNPEKNLLYVYPRNIIW